MKPSKLSGEASARISLIASMLIFGTIGLLRRSIPLSSGMIAFVRGLIGTLFLLGILALKKQKIAWKSVKQNGWILLLSGVFIGFNWILLFEAYNYTTVATATLCYYMSPVFVILASPIFLKERLTAKKLVCVTVSLAGMLLVSGVFSEGGAGGDLRGIFFGLGAALLYASVVLLNQKIENLPAYDKTVVQLASATAVMIPYLLFTEDFSAIVLTSDAVLLLLVAGVVHTGIAYTLYFGSMSRLNAQTVAIFGYIDPVAAILLSAVVLKERMEPAAAVGAVLILVSAVISELPKFGSGDKK